MISSGNNTLEFKVNIYLKLNSKHFDMIATESVIYFLKNCQVIVSKLSVKLSVNVEVFRN